MSVPRENATTGQRLKALEQEVARLRLQASSTVTTVAPTDAMPRSTWIDPSANNAPYFLDDSGNWLPVRDGNIAVAQATANSALAASTDGLPPASSPAAELIGGIGALFIRWPAVANANPVTYKVYVDTTTGFTEGPGNLVGQLAGTFLTVRTLTAGTALTYGTTYYAKIVATDADGAAAAGVEGSGAMVQVNSPDIAANSIVAGKIAAGTIVAGDIAAGAITAAKLDAAAITGKTITGGLFQTMTSGRRIEIDSATGNLINYYSGAAGEIAPGTIEGGETSAGSGVGKLAVTSPLFTGSSQSRLTLSNVAGGSAVDLGGKDVTITGFTVQVKSASHTLQINASGLTLDTVPIATTTDAQALTNKNLTSGTNTFPATLATLAGTETLTNKTLTSPTITGTGAITAASLNLGLGSTINDAYFGSGSFTTAAAGLITIPHPLGVTPSGVFLSFQNSTYVGGPDTVAGTPTTSVRVNVRDITAAGAPTLIAGISVVCRYLFIV